MGHFIPLLNDYKQEFVLKRLLQTVFGGPKLLIGYDAPLYVYIAQVLYILIYARYFKVCLSCMWNNLSHDVIQVN